MISEVLKTALPLAEMTIIKRDFDLLQKVFSALSSQVNTYLTPYLALFCYEVIGYINRQGTDIRIEQTSRYSIKDMRQKAKFFDLRISKLLQSIENVDRLQNDYFINLMRFPFLGYWNIHTNIGIFFDDEKHIVGNTHYAYYLFQDEKSISQPKETMDSVELEGNELKAFGYDMGRVIGSISSALSRLSDFITADVYDNSVQLHSQDFNTNRCIEERMGKYKYIRLFLLHVLSSIGFVLYYVKKIVIRDTGLLLRLEYITYHYALIRLEGILQYCKSNTGMIDDANLIQALERLNCSSASGLIKTAFRNCMMHFSLMSDDGKPLIQEDKLDLSVPFCGLIESQFNMTYSEYKEKIESALEEIYAILNNYLGFDLLLCEEN